MARGWTKGLYVPENPDTGDVHLDMDGGLWVYTGAGWHLSIVPQCYEIPMDLIIHDLQLMRAELE